MEDIKDHLLDRIATHSFHIEINKDVNTMKATAQEIKALVAALQAISKLEKEIKTLQNEIIILKND